MTRWLGYLAALSWLTLAAVTASGSVLIDASLVHVNFTMAGVFAAIAAFLAWRARVVDALRRRYTDSPEIGRLLLVEGISSTGAFILGTGCLTAAALRVWSEGVAVFG